MVGQKALISGSRLGEAVGKRANGTGKNIDSDKSQRQPVHLEEMKVVYLLLIYL